MTTQIWICLQTLTPGHNGVIAKRLGEFVIKQIVDLAGPSEQPKPSTIDSVFNMVSLTT